MRLFLALPAARKSYECFSVIQPIKGEPMVSKILVPTDGSKTAKKAALYALDLAKQLNATVIVLSVIDQRSYVGQTVSPRQTARHVIEPIEDYLREAAEGYAAEVMKLCDTAEVEAKTMITAGHPVESIVKEAERAKVGMIVMGSHGKSAFTAAVLGSVTYGVIHKGTKIPVLIVRG
jgi:nucleotide-binding universal stress UspA family protein